jgi:hypothetical protein
METKFQIGDILFHESHQTHYLIENIERFERDLKSFRTNEPFIESVSRYTLFEMETGRKAVREYVEENDLFIKVA